MYNLRETLRDAFEAHVEAKEEAEAKLEAKEPQEKLQAKLQEKLQEKLQAKLEVPRTDLFKVFTRELNFNGNYFIAGLLLGLHAPTLSWFLLTGVFVTPSVIVFRHSEWFESKDPDSWVDIMKIVYFCLASDLFATYCISRVLI